MKQAHMLTAAAAAGLAGIAFYSFSGPDAPPDTGSATAETSAEQSAEGALLADAGALEEIDRLTAELASRDTRIVSLTEQIASLEDEIATLSEAPGPDADTAALLAERDAAIAELESVLAERDATIAGLQADIAARDERRAETGGALTEAGLSDPDSAAPDDLLAGDTAKILPGPGEAEALQTALAASETRTLPARAPEAAPEAGTARAAFGADPIAEVHFESGSSTLTVGGQTRALAAAAVLTALPDGMIRLTGHTDTTGAPEFNRRLSEARAQAVAEMLISAGIPADRIEIVPHGQDADALPIATGEGVREPLNRCVMIWPVSATG